ncbi:MAG: Gfo/Idh/MocA family oxidoreductase [Clostridia bacterium]
MKKIGIIGYGLRSATLIKAFHSLEADISVAAIVDPRANEIREQVSADPIFAHTAYLDSPEALYRTPGLDGLMIATRCSLHTDLACQALQTDLPLFLEKPVCISDEQYARLRTAAQGRESNVVVSFPLRLSSITLALQKLIQRGDIGRISMVQAVNNVPYGSVYYHSWYRNPAETGGLFLQKATHDVDYIQSLIGKLPNRVYAAASKTHFLGNRPANLHCPDCGEYLTCPESSYVVKNIRKEEVQGDHCCFAADTGNEDHASALFTCTDGTLISYSQCFIVKRGAARRGARLIGDKGSAEFDFYTGEIRVDCYEDPETITHKFTYPAGAHFGGDERLVLAFMDLMNGKPSTNANLDAGLKSAAMCLAAKRSSLSGQAECINY